VRKVEFEVPSVAQGYDPVPAWRSGTGPSQTFVSYKDNSNVDPRFLTLDSAFQYTHGAGLPYAQKVLTDLTRFFHAPPGDHVVTLSLGNSDGVSKAFRMLGEKGDYFLTENFGFPGMTNAPLSYGIKWIGVKMDKEGLIPDEIEKILKNWDHNRGRRPHVLYLVP
jgi:aromatic amino acid aminotransferase I